MKQNKKIDELIDEIGKEEILKYINDFNKPFDYTDIKSFEDACQKLSINSNFSNVLFSIDNKSTKSIIANYKLCIIYEAINNGWIPDYTDPNQYKYYPYFKVLPSGLVCSNTSYACDGTITFIGVRLCTDTAVKAKYIGKQFKYIYEDYLL